MCSMKKTLTKVETNTMHQKMFEQNHDAIIILSRTGEVTECNETAKTLFKKTKQQLLGKKFETFLSKGEHQEFQKAINRVLRKKTHEQLYLVQSQQDVLMIDMQRLSICEDVCVELVFHVHSYQKEIERHLRLAKTSHKTFLEMMQDDIFVLDPQMHVLYLNEHAAKNFHVHRDNMIGKSIGTIFPKNVKHIKESVDYIVAHKQPLKRESLFHFPKGVSRWLHTELIPILGEKDVIAILGVSHDVTQRKEQEMQIQQLEKKYETLVEKSSDGVIVIQQEKIVFANQRIEHMLGLNRQQLIGELFVTFIEKKDQKNIKTKMQYAFKAGVCDIRCEFKMQSSVIAPFKIEAHGSLVDYEGKPAIMVVVRDKSQDEEIEKMKSDFVSVTSHQMRTPLTGIKWFSEVLLNGTAGKLNSDQKEYVSKISESTERMVRLVNDLLEVSRMDTGEEYSLYRKKTDVCALLHQVIEEQTAAFSQKAQHIQLSGCDEKGIQLNIDAAKIRAVFNNILNNALKYSPKKSNIAIVCKCEADHLLISFQDHGVGIPKKQQKQIFQRFFRADNVLTTESGTGLGLYFAKFLLEKHQGKIWFESEENKGTTVYLTLPLDSQKFLKKK